MRLHKNPKAAKRNLFKVLKKLCFVKLFYVRLLSLLENVLLTENLILFCLT